MDNYLTIGAILGAGNDAAGNIDSDAIQRCDLAIEMLTNIKQAKLILCGGFGDHFNITDQQHYKYLKEYIESKLNNFEASVLGCVDSYNTIDDIQGINTLIKPLISNNIKLVIITNDYHVLRASILAKIIITSENVTVQFLSVSSLKDVTMLSSRLEHEVGRIKEYLSE
ncbi:MAG: hypothetical protein GQ581_04310 [Methyloprofundus sp.]|nr:hypothetical protein [Methyloprofundus sp.]